MPKNAREMERFRGLVLSLEGGKPARARTTRAGAAVDIPWCEGDLFFIEKLALALGRP